MDETHDSTDRGGAKPDLENPKPVVAPASAAPDAGHAGSAQPASAPPTPDGKGK